MPSYNWDKKFETKNYDVQVCTDSKYGYFEHHEHGEDRGGGLWFEGLELIDHDGTACLPKEVATCLRENGFIVGEEYD